MNDRQPWTADSLAAVLSLRPEDVLPSENGGSNKGHERRPEAMRRWRWIDYAQRLVWSYGFDEALRRLSGSPEPEARAA